MHGNITKSKVEIERDALLAEVVRLRAENEALKDALSTTGLKLIDALDVLATDQLSIPRAIVYVKAALSAVSAALDGGRDE